MLTFSLVLLVTINCQKKVRNQPCENLDHEPIPTPGNQMIHFEMAFPPGKKDFDVPTELINRGDLLGGKVKPVGGNPVFFGANPVGNHPQLFFGLVYTGGSEENDGVIKDEIIRLHFQGADTRFLRTGLNPADKVFSFGLPEVEVLMALVVAIQNAGLPWRQDLVGPRDAHRPCPR